MFPATGRCLCGAVTVVAKAAPVRMAQCHCLDCQRNTGTGHANNAFFKETDVEVSGETNSFTITADSGNKLTRHFCGICGSRVFGINTGRAGMITLPAGIFANSGWYQPQMILFQGRRPAWDPELPGIDTFDAMPPAPAPAKT